MSSLPRPLRPPRPHPTLRPLRTPRTRSTLRFAAPRPLRIALALLLVVLAGAAAEGKSRDRGKKGRSREVEREPKSPPSLALESLDLGAARAVVIVGGASRAPDARLFVFHDAKERHFVALYAACDDASKVEEREQDVVPAPEAPESIALRKVPDPSVPVSDPPLPAVDVAVAPSVPVRFEVAIPEGALRCRLDVPRPYLRSHVVGLTLRLRGKEVALESAAFEAAWGAAQKSARLPTTPLAVPMTSVQVPCEDPGMLGAGVGQVPNAADEEEVEETEDPTED